MRPLYGRPTDLAADGDGAWAVTVDTAALTRVDARTGTITRSLPLRSRPARWRSGRARCGWPTARRGELVRVVPGYDEMSPQITFRRGRPPKRRRPGRDRRRGGCGGVWVTDGSERLVRVDPRHSRPTAIDVGMPLDGVTVGAGAVWAISGRDRERAADRSRHQSRDRPDRDRRAARRGRAGPGVDRGQRGSRVGPQSQHGDGGARSIRPAAGSRAPIAIGVDRVPNEIVAAGRTAWVANEDGSLSRIDEKAREARSVWVGESLRQAATNGARLWVGTASLDQQLPGGVG